MTWEEFQRDFLDFDGRVQRLPFFWKPLAFGLVVSLFLMLCETILPQSINGFIFKLAPVLNIIINASFIVRRCHDIGKSGWWGLLTLVPLVNFVFLIYLLFKEGDHGYNQYGPEPLD